MTQRGYRKNDSSSYGIQGTLRVRSVVLFQVSSSLGAAGHSCGACCFQNCSNAIELAMIASSTVLMQACKRGAPSARVVGLNECSTEGRKAVCVSSTKIFCGVQFFGQEPILSAKYSTEVLDAQLASAVSRSSVRWD